MNKLTRTEQVKSQIRKRVLQINKMSDDGQFANSSDKSDFSQKFTPNKETPNIDKQVSISSFLSKEGFQPPRELPKRSYSLEPDIATGWKPKKIGTNLFNNVFPINFSSEVIDYLLKQLYRRKSKEWQIAYLGPRKINSYLIHQNRKYENPYPMSKKLDPHISQRPQIPLHPVLQEKNLKFNSNFECGNLDAAIFVSPNQYDLFMRVDSNTKGHTNWYFFAVQNGNFVGSVRFNMCNFRRDKSLYQRGLKPYFYSKRSSESWKQGGQNVRYQKRPLRYNFLYEDEDYAMILKNYITLTFTYHFEIPNDTVELAYFIPYSYSRLLKFLPTLRNCKIFPPLKSLSGLSIPVLEVTDQEAQAHNKKVVIVTARIHPGEANSSFICQGFLEYICGDQSKAKEFRQQFIAYVIPMINPDGVVVGNYRTSLFGKDLNRTFNQSRKFAFPQTFHLLELIKDLKAKYKQRLNLFIDLHGHSVKKNVFMYGPEFNIQHPNYYLAKELPKLLSTLTPCFRFYSCIFRISSEKSTTARATLNRFLNIPFTYTMESSNGFYYDSESKKEFQLTSKKLKKIGVALCQALLMFKEIQNNRSMGNFHSSNNNFSHRKRSETDAEIQQITESKEKALPLIRPGKSSKLNFISDLNDPDGKTADFGHLLQNVEIPRDEVLSDDNISEGNSDSQPADEDLSDSQLDKLLQTIQQGRQNSQTSPQKHLSHHESFTPNSHQKQAIFKLSKFSSRMTKQKSRYKKKNPLLPPINCLNRAMAKQKVGNKSFLQKGGETTFAMSSPQKQKPQKQRRSKHLSISQMIEDAKVDLGTLAVIKKEEIFLAQTIMRKKASKIEMEKVKFFANSPYTNNSRH